MKYLFLLIQLFIMATSLTAQESKKLIYVGDPMCSWCYGISAEWEQAYQHYEGELEVELVMGGLRPYNTQSMTELKDFLTHHWEDVHAASGQEFSYDILDRTDLVYDTEPPSRATVIVRQLAPSKEQAFFHLIQKIFYQENKNMSVAESYHSALAALGISIAAFDKAFDSDSAKEDVRQDFGRAKELGVSSFPTILLEIGSSRSVIARGFVKAPELIALIRSRI